MDSRDSSQSTAAVNNSSAVAPDDDAFLSVTATLAKEAALYFQSGKFDECLDLLNQLLEKKPHDPKVIFLIILSWSKLGLFVFVSQFYELSSLPLIRSDSLVLIHLC